MPWATDESRVFEDAATSIEQEQQSETQTGDAEPMLAAHSESPFEEPLAESYSGSTFEIEAPPGIHLEPAPVAAEVATPFPEEPLSATSDSVAAAPSEESDVFAPADTAKEDLTNTLTMADLYARQGLIDDARQIYESILLRDPENAIVREKLDALRPPTPAPLSPLAPQPAPQDAKVKRLESWLHKVARREESRVL